ncbi:hypothetical protein OCH239_15760 [Roseivivax halodurans JCM 10272]|uniref:SnoaL-like domain-containing protein n=1 Tax=Roseivivax halodurans JCM 10272 TaxID=1449350 RepID=X7ECK0_9RHOB|nr:nuclear transport factor 2 family protein [Roseivivax halodurans]ETX12843.1 hypothetical protein OCH239_15760 [Roseivivax halodurans JCM 10272]
MTDPDADGGGYDPQGEAVLDEWRRIFIRRDWDGLPELLADDVTYHTPAEAMPLHGKDALVASLRQSFDLFGTFGYAREFVGDAGHVLEFRGSVGGAAFTGIDIISFDSAGKVTELVVMIRPMSTMMRRGGEAGR